MKASTLVKFSLEALIANKLRSCLTILGIVIGVAAVILMLAIGQGAQASVDQQIQSLGSNMLIIRPGAAGQFVRGAGGQRTTLTADDAQAITQLPFVKSVAPEVSGQSLLAVNGDKTWTTSVSGTTPDYLSIKSLQVSQGRFFSEKEASAGDNLAVIGPTVAENLFGTGENPVGQTIRVGNIMLTVIGVTKSTGASSGGQDQDDIIYIPVRTAQIRLLGQNYVNSINVQVDSKDDLDSVTGEITTLLEQRHHIQAGADDDFNVLNMTSITQTAENVTKMMTLFLAGVAAISLIVGGIGIMNIMLVSVTERTKEIGVRMAVGAKDTDVLKQFLLEAVFLSLVGAFVGIMLGYIGSTLFGYFTSWSMHISLNSILLSVGFSLVIGVFFGYYPARRAAALNPAEALSYE